MTIFHPDTPKKCPPKDAVPSSEIYYRIVFNDPPIAEDFYIWVHVPKNAHKLDEKRKKSECSAFAISMFTTEEATSRVVTMFQRGVLRKAKRNAKNFLGVAKIKLNLDSGVLKQTGRDSYHYDLWPYHESKLEHNVISVRGV